jgi:hypothetical protein
MACLRVQPFSRDRKSSVEMLDLLVVVSRLTGPTMMSPIVAGNDNGAQLHHRNNRCLILLRDLTDTSLTVPIPPQMLSCPFSMFLTSLAMLRAASPELTIAADSWG